LNTDERARQKKRKKGGGKERCGKQVPSLGLGKRGGDPINTERVIIEEEEESWKESD